MITTKPQLYKWLKANADFVSSRAIETKLKIPRGTINKWMRDIRPLPEKHVPATIDLVNKICGHEAAKEAAEKAETVKKERTKPLDLKQAGSAYLAHRRSLKSSNGKKE